MEMGLSASFEDTIRNLLRMKPKPHKGKAEDEPSEKRSPDDEKPKEPKEPNE